MSSENQRTAVALTIAGSDPSGGAGLQADLKTFQELNVYGMTVVTLITVQNTTGVSRVELLSTDLIEQQLEAVLSDIPPAAIKTGALGNAEIVECVGRRLSRWKQQHPECAIVVDPVLVSKHGHSLVTDDVVAAYKKFLLPLTTILTPNRFEAEKLSGVALDSVDAAQRALRKLSMSGAENVLVKLGDIDGASLHVWGRHDQSCLLRTPRLNTTGTHGTGCILAAAITAGLANTNCELPSQIPDDATLKSIVNAAIQRVFDAISGESKLGTGLHPADVRAFRH